MGSAVGKWRRDHLILRDYLNHVLVYSSRLFFNIHESHFSELEAGIVLKWLYRCHGRATILVLVISLWEWSKKKICYWGRYLAVQASSLFPVSKYLQGC